MYNIMIRNNMKNNKYSIIYDGIFIGVSVKIIGDVFLARNVKVGVNTVVNKSMLEENIAVVSIQAKAIKRNNKEVS